MTRRSGVPGLLGTVVTALVCISLAACSPSPDRPRTGSTRTSSPDPTSQAPAERTQLSYGVFGTDEEIAAYQDVVDAYNAQASTVEVTLRSWPTSGAMMGAIISGAETPDIYQVARTDLTDIVEQGRNVALFSLLEDRDVSYGDNYPLDTIEAFSRGNDLQCMPYGISPKVMYINTDLIDFNRIRLRELPAPAPDLGGWDVEMFAAAAQFATRPRQKSRGLSIEPTLDALAPYLYSGGGSLFDDDADPTSLDLSSGSNQETLATVLALARNPLITLTDTQLRRATPREWFERGRLGMLEGDRSMTPDLREVDGLTFDVMPMPRVSRTATTGDVTGVCISPGPKVQRAADFLVHLISAEGFTPVAEAGYVVPANTAVARSDVFLQQGLQPANSGIFNLSVDAMELLPLVTDDPELQAVVGPLVKRLFTTTLPPDLEVATAAIDEASRSVLDPTYVPEPSVTPAVPPSAELPSATPTPDSSG